MKRIIATILICLLSGTLAPANVMHAAFNPHFLATDQQLLDMDAMTKAQLNDFLTRGALADLETADHNVTIRPAADIIWNASREFFINPQFLLVLLQREQSLVEADNPTQKQLDWAMGYGVCDDCDMDDPRIEKFKGFGNQVYYAAKRIRESYLVDLLQNGHTISGIGPGIEVMIDGRTVEPVNSATSVLYTYTPHLHGNQNFVTIWEDWFTHRYPSGSLLENEEDETVWYIKYGQRHEITSKTALYSRFDPRRVIPVEPTILQPYPVGTPISYPNYSLLRSPRGTVYLLVDDTMRGIASGEAFRAIGFNPDEIIDVPQEEIDQYPEGEPITEDITHPRGRLMQNTETGGVFHVINEQKASIFSREILESRFAGWSIEPMPAETLDAYTSTEPVQFPDGTLIAKADSPDVFIVADEGRHLIPDEETFLSYGWKWDQIVWTDERSVLIHPLGSDIRPLEPEDDPALDIALTE